MIRAIIKSVPFLYTPLRLFLSFCRRSKYTVKYFLHKEESKKNGDIIILGNGPSLKSDIGGILAKRKIIGGKIMVVNQFCLDKNFFDVKPDYYVLADPAYFVDAVASSFHLENRQVLIKTLSEGCTWPLLVVLPEAGRSSFFIKEVGKNKNIHFVFINSNHVYHPFFVKRFNSYNKNTSTPIFQNVLQMCIYYSILNRFANIFVFGADHNWCKDITVTHENAVAIEENHCYEEQNHKTHIMEQFDGSPWSMGELFQAWANVYNGYYDLARYACYNGVHIYNESSVSFVDAFPRKSGRF